MAFSSFPAAALKASATQVPGSWCSADLAQCVDRLTMLFAFQRKMLLAEGGWLASVPYWDAKLKVGAHIMQDAQHAEAILQRLHELKATSAEHKQPSGLDDLMRNLTCARNGDEWLTGLYRHIKPWFIAQLAQYLAGSDPVMDAPSREIVERIMREQRQHVDWFENYQPEFSAWEHRDVADWGSYVGNVLARASLEPGMQLGSGPQESRPAGCEDFPGDASLRRDATSHVVDPHDAFPEGSSFEERRFLVFYHHVQEMQFAESLGAILYGTPEMPWAFHYDVSRHLVDEIRHSRMGQERLAQLGVRIPDIPMFKIHYEFRSRLHPLERFALMTLVIEAGAFESKRENLRLFEQHRDLVSALYESYDIRDEMLHTSLGHLWLPIMLRVYHDTRTVAELVDHCRGISTR